MDMPSSIENSSIWKSITAGKDKLKDIIDPLAAKSKSKMDGATDKWYDKWKDKFEENKLDKEMNSKSIFNLTQEPIEGANDVITLEELSGVQGFAAYLIECTRPEQTDENEKEKGKVTSGFAIRRPLLGTAEKSNAPASLYLNIPYYISDTTTVNDLAPKIGDNTLYDSLKGPGVNSNVSFNFLLQNIQQIYVENVQLVQTFGKTYFFFFGAKPTSVMASGILLNTPDFNWRNDFLANYLDFLRGTKASLAGRQVTLAYDDLFLTGYILSFTMSESADSRDLANFTFEMVLTNIMIAPSITIKGKTPHDYESSKDKLTKEYYEYLGPSGLTTKDLAPPPKATVHVYTSFADILQKYCGFNIRWINRIKTALNIVKGGNIKEIAATAAVWWSTAAAKRGAHIYELDRILTNKPDEVL